MIEKTEDKETSVSFDGRLHYYKVLGLYLEDIRTFSNLNNYNNWYITLRRMFSMVCGLIKRSDEEQIRKELEELKNLLRQSIGFSNLRNSDMIIQSLIIDKLNDLTDNIIKASKRLLVPVNNDEYGYDEDDWDEEAFMKASDM